MKPFPDESSEKELIPDFKGDSFPNNKPIPILRFVIPLLIQAGLLFSIPAQSAYTYITGITVILQTVPVDPYSLLTGYYQILSYDISTRGTLEKLPGSKDVLKDGKSFYVILQEVKSTDEKIPKAWKPIRLSKEIPDSLPDNQVALKGNYRYGRVKYGLEQYNMPEDQRNQINKNISQARRSTTQRDRQPIVVEIKVDSQGKSVPVSMWVKEKNYRF
ncbi:putative membrane-anchored protein [Rivularia sp. PCC 7116]|uniref:GDYXXLXY domain-containing protein n=1 Tax=Rivularia sp. PCC 7116 TaxID=373994 RepID=UPI00029F0E99|nr:GDYXXLXY domain-containing protein [Rivularia sp. PCC 7116]AFY58382.1 putative membrane-anchored protein [Rivularia sp. PCC 7116]